MTCFGSRARLRSLVALLGCIAVAAVAACSYAYNFDYRITIDEAVDLVEIGEGADVVMAVALEDDVALADGYGETQALDPDRREYRGTGSTCCSPSEQVYLFAFIDIDRDGMWTEGEPWGEDPKNPVLIEDDDYVSRIEIGPALLTE